MVHRYLQAVPLRSHLHGFLTHIPLMKTSPSAKARVDSEPLLSLPTPSPHPPHMLVPRQLTALSSGEWGTLSFFLSSPFFSTDKRDKERRKLQQGGFRDHSRKDSQIWTVSREEDRLGNRESVNLVGGTRGAVRRKQRRMG